MTITRLPMRLRLHEAALLLVKDPVVQHEVDDEREGEAGRDRVQEPQRPHVGDEGDEPDRRDRADHVGGEVRILHHRDVEADVLDGVEGEHRERSRGRRSGGDRERDERLVARPTGEADEAVAESGEDPDPRSHAHQHFR